MSPKPAQEFGSVVQDFALPIITYGPERLSQIMEGRRGAVVVFWSGVCSHCVRYDAYLNSFSKLHPELALVAIASRYGETIPQIRSTVAERRLTFPLLHDQGGVVAQQWITQQTPRAFLLDANRGLLYRGAIDNFKYPNEPEYAGYLENAIEDFLAARPVRRSETAGFGCAIQSVYYILPRHL